MTRRLPINKNLVYFFQNEKIWHSASIESLQETDVELEQRVEELEDYIIGELLSCDIVMNIYVFLDASETNVSKTG